MAANSSIRAETKIYIKELRTCNITSIKDHVHEVLVVIEPNAVGNPRAMMIHLQHTSTALTAMMCSLRLEFLAMVAKTLVASLQRAHYRKVLDFFVSQMLCLLIH